MSVYVGIDVHRKRSQVAVVAEDGRVQVNRNVPNGVEPILKVIGDLPTGTPVAFEAAYGWGTGRPHGCRGSRGLRVGHTGGPNWWRAGQARPSVDFALAWGRLRCRRPDLPRSLSSRRGRAGVCDPRTDSRDRGPGEQEPA